jgi:hypothetical protein
MFLPPPGAKSVPTPGAAISRTKRPSSSWISTCETTSFMYVSTSFPPTMLTSVSVASARSGTISFQASRCGLAGSTNITRDRDAPSFVNT